MYYCFSFTFFKKQSYLFLFRDGFTLPQHLS